MKVRKQSLCQDEQGPAQELVTPNRNAHPNPIPGEPLTPEEDRVMDRRASERLCHQEGQQGQDGHGGKEPVEVKVAVLFQETAWTPFPPKPGGWRAEVKTAFQGSLDSGGRQNPRTEQEMGRQVSGALPTPRSAHLEPEDGSGEEKMPHSTLLEDPSPPPSPS